MRRPKWTVAAVIGAMAVSACHAIPLPDLSRSAAQSPSPRPTSVTYVEAQDPEAQPPAPPVPNARSGGTLRVLSSRNPHTFDPTRVYHLDTLAIMKLVTRSLTQTRYENGKPVLVPDLATDLGRPNKDFTRWEFTLRDGLKYEDGTPVTAADVAYAIKRQFAQEELPGGPTYGIDYYLGGETYRGPFKDGDDFEAVETPDDKTIVLKMRKPFPSLRYYASLPAFAPIPKDKDTRGEYSKHPLATGPYKFDGDWDGKRLTLVRNEHWDPETDPGRHQLLDKIVFEFGLDGDEVQKRIIADEGPDQYAITYNDILVENYRAIRGTEAEKRLVTGPSPCTTYMWIDTRKVPLPVRRAIAKAWPLESESRAAGAVPGLTWRPATTIMPSATPGWIPHDAIGNGGKGDGDPEAARKMLEEAGQLGFELSFYYSADDPIDTKIAEVRAEALERAGFVVKTLPAPSSLARDLSDDAIRPANLRAGSWCMDWGSGDSVLPAILDGRKADLPGAPIQSFLNVREVNEEIERISRLPADKALAEWGKLDQMIMEKYLPVVPLGEGGTTLLHGSKVANVVVDTVLGMPDYTQIYLLE
ncbi:ABC transporter substrate-binding protein [Thermasporomyces composti]|jgi:peptide/nickel transport system substrate-binding protein|uniref:Peptide/nickel transport system substrate-binding protein n=1 Tax=Thermasporomyces composti TaxID=696763 RepID=A0A3D9V743_THECX|nr:ABC transporter substrate-binding protein [Thermasporomyces composti]REF37136.1 peptide/nickel transport system substrate-binding protein [Thermasporomyces composti]